MQVVGTQEISDNPTPKIRQIRQSSVLTNSRQETTYRLEDWKFDDNNMDFVRSQPAPQIE